MKLFDILLLCLLGALWGSAFIFLRISAPEFGPFVVVTLRLIVACIFLLPFIIYRHEWREISGQWRDLLFLSIMGTAIPFVLFSYTLTQATASFSSMLNITMVFFTSIIARFWLGESLSRTGWAGIVIGAIGVYILITDKESLDPGSSFLPIAAGLTAACMYGIATCYLRANLRHAGTYAIAFGSLIYAIPLLSPFALTALPSEPPSVQAWISVVSVGILSTGIAFIIFFRLVKTIGATKSSLVTYLIPLFAIMWGVLLLDEPITIQIVLGGAVILLGVSLTMGIGNRLYKD